MINTKAIIVLTVFCAVICAQAACAAGWLLHCAHAEEQVHHQDPCPEDQCGTDFPVPSFDVKTRVEPGSVVLPSGGKISKESAKSFSLPCLSALTSQPAPPVGSFPLLI